MTFWRNVDNGPKKSSLNYGDVLDSRETLTFDLSRFMIKSKRFDHEATYYVM